MAELSSAPVKTFSVGFEEEQFSELPYARAVAQKYATDHQEFTLTYGDIPATLEKIGDHLANPLRMHRPSRFIIFRCLTRQYVTVALNGDGGDEDFAGYQRYWLDPLANLYLKSPRLLNRSLVPSIVHHLPDGSNRPVGQSLVNGLKRSRTTAADRCARQYFALGFLFCSLAATSTLERRVLEILLRR